ncbi:MAG: helix-turn-helix domain-containing protein [Vulcanimicrobiaceae bacterium]
MTHLKTSADQFWSGFEARTYVVLGGFVETSAYPCHGIRMLTGTPIPSSLTCDGVSSQRLQISGDIDVVPAGTPIAWKDEGSTSFVSVRLRPLLVRAAAEGMDIDPDRAEIVPQFQLRDPLIEHILWALKAELECETPLGRIYAESLGLALAAQLVRRYAALAPRPRRSGLPKLRLQRVLDYVRENVAADLSLAELASVAELSQSHFKVLFRNALGMPVHQYVIRQRVEHATELLLKGRLPLSEVALIAGFANQSHLARSMRRITGTTPREMIRRTS